MTDSEARSHGGWGAVLPVCCTVLALTCPSALADDVAGVVELFTSQGCSSCPPADEALARLAASEDLVALTFAVDYWDYLGWKDTFAKPEFTKRQRGYATGRGDNSVYTPQAVINGRADVLGSDEQAIRATLQALRSKGEGLPIDITARIKGDRIVVEVPAGPPPAPGSMAGLWIAAYRQPEPVEIAVGENKGRKVVYTNVVERWQVLGMWNGQAMTVELPLSDLVQDKTAGCAVVLQTKINHKPGPILGAAKVTLPSG